MVDEVIFEVRDAAFSYPGGHKVLGGITFDVRKGERISLLGANASGKSTLLYLLDGLSFPERGNVTAFGVKLSEESVETQPFCGQFRQRVGYLFQDSDAQLFCTTVEEELAFGPLQLRLVDGDVDRRVEDTLKLFEIEHLRGRSPQTLSGGEKNRVALASIFTCGPQVILLDEPTAGLDPRSQQWLTEFLNGLNKAGVTLILATHDLAFAAEITDRALILSEDHTLLCDKPVVDALSDLDLLLSANLIYSHTHKHGTKVHSHPYLPEVLHDHRHDATDL